MSVSTPNYIIKEDYLFGTDYYQRIRLEAGTFVRPISPYYIPAHIKEAYKDIYTPNYEYVYCSLGILCIPKYIIVKVSE